MISHNFTPQSTQLISRCFSGTPSLAVNDFLIAAATLPAIDPDISVYEIKHDLTLKRSQKAVIPDGWIDFRLNDKTQLCIWLEMDMGTMDQKPFRKKISALIDFSRQSYEHIFGTPSLTIVFATPAGEQRLNNILNWTQKELTDRQSEQNADLFRFLCVPEQVFCAPICVCPFDSRANGSCVESGRVVVVSFFR